MLASPIAYTQYFLTSSALRLLDFKAAKKIGKCKYLLLSSSLLTKVPEAFPQDCLPMPKSHPLPVSEWPLTFVVAQLLPSLCLTSRITYSDDNRKLTGIKHPRVVSYITSFQIFFTSPLFAMQSPSTHDLSLPILYYMLVHRFHKNFYLHLQMEHQVFIFSHVPVCNAPEPQGVHHH